MSNDREARRSEHSRHRRSDIKAVPGEINTGCPCPRIQCKNYGLCVPCREKHKKSPPYCERRTDA